MNTPQSAHPRQDAVSPAATAEETWKPLLRYAVRAPSGHNTQPWRFKINHGPARTPQPGDHQLFEAIEERHAHRAAFGAGAVPGTVLAQLAAETRRHGATDQPTVNPTPRRTVADVLTDTASTIGTPP